MLKKLATVAGAVAMSWACSRRLSKRPPTMTGHCSDSRPRSPSQEARCPPATTSSAFADPDSGRSVVQVVGVDGTFTACSSPSAPNAHCRQRCLN